MVLSGPARRFIEVMIMADVVALVQVLPQRSRTAANDQTRSCSIRVLWTCGCLFQATAIEVLRRTVAMVVPGRSAGLAPVVPIRLRSLPGQRLDRCGSGWGKNP